MQVRVFKAKIGLKYLVKLILSNVHLKIIDVYAIKCLAINIDKDILAFHTSFIRVLSISELRTFLTSSQKQSNEG